MSRTGELQLSELDFENIIGLSDSDPVNTFEGMWRQLFLRVLISSILVHGVAAAIALGMLRRHKIGRFIPGIILIMGFLSPLFGGALTSVAIAGVYIASGFEMQPLHALVWGVGQTIVVIFISFTRILATL